MAVRVTMKNLASRAQVLIVGAGPVGLAAGIELAQRGIRCRVIDETGDVGFNPRAKLTNVRSMELMRRWGIAAEVRRASPLGAEYPANIIFATSLTGYQLARFTNAFCCDRERNELYSEPAQWIPQYALMSVLRDHLRKLPNAELTYNCRLETMHETASGTKAHLRNTVSGESSVTECGFLIGADGARSTVRKQLGIKMNGQHAYSRNYGVVLRAPGLGKQHSLGEAIQYWLVNPACPSILGPMDKGDLWFFGALLIADDLDVSAVDPGKMIRLGTGLDFEFEVVTIDPWVTHRLVAESYRSGHIFLAGDACHLHPPTGGYGMNMGIGDALDLGWKLAAVLQGWGGESLLDTYEIERRPLHLRVIDEAVENFRALPNQMVRDKLTEPGPLGDAIRAAVGKKIVQAKTREFSSLGVVLGCRYQDSPIIVPDGSSPPPDDFETYQPSACPGCLAPHHWLTDGSSLYDHFGPGFTLITTPDDADAASELVAAAADRGIPFEIFRHDDPVIAALYQSRYTLIRPDQFVAWRGDIIPGDPGRLLDRVRGV
jgi:2-polyprenyl-6-methoxyphenol hydroxylase-like FAD-dependent oxidoreductase